MAVLRPTIGHGVSARAPFAYTEPSPEPEFATTISDRVPLDQPWDYWAMAPRANIHDAQLEFDDDDPPGYRAAAARIGAAAGGRELVVKLFEIPPGESLCPYHYEYVEEWLLVLDGEITLRTPPDRRERTRRPTRAPDPLG
jgi:hypothetical protein